MNDRQVFAEAGVSLEEANAAKEDLLGRTYDFLAYPDEDPEETSLRFAQMRENISQIMDPNLPLFGFEDLPLDKREGFQAVGLAVLSQSTAEIPGMALSLHDVSSLSGVSLEMLEDAYTMIRPDLASQNPAPQVAKRKKKASTKSKKRRR
jgi:hypothetical protein